MSTSASNSFFGDEYPAESPSQPPQPPARQTVQPQPTAGVSAQEVVASSSDAAGLHAPVPALLLEMQMALGNLAAVVTHATDRGRRPFRTDADWQRRIGDLAYGIYLLADQTGVDLEQAVRLAAQEVSTHAQQAAARTDRSWPVGE